MLTDLQRERCSFHLGLIKHEGISKVNTRNSLSTLTAEQELGLVGDPDSSNRFVFQGVDLCDQESALGKVEAAHAAITPSVIDPSLFVKAAGKVTLRGNELTNRYRLYQMLVNEMKLLVGMSLESDGSGRVGF